MELTPLPSADPAALTLPELVRLYEDLAPKAGTPFKTSVEKELTARLKANVTRCVCGTFFRFAVDPLGDLVKTPIVPAVRPKLRVPTSKRKAVSWT